MKGNGEVYNMQENSEQQPVVTFTASAVQHLQRQLAKEAGAKIVRLYVKTAGCSGLQYKFAFEAEAVSDDIACDTGQQLIVYIDKKAIPFIAGTMIDYVKHGLNAEFKFTNPLEKGSCGCGESFYV
ncbi:MAG: HesB/IscA family protein [Gammaproteobacteria bacterium]